MEFLRFLETITQTVLPVVESVLEEFPTDQGTETVSPVEVVRKTGAITQSAISHLTQILELPANEGTENVFNSENVRKFGAITRSFVSCVTQVLKESPNNQASDEAAANSETVSGFGSNEESVMPDVTNETDIPSNQNIEPADNVEMTVCQAEATTQSINNEVEELEECKGDQETEANSYAEDLNTSDTNETLKEIVGNDQCSDTALKMTDILPLSKVVEGLTCHVNGDHERGNKVLVSVGREAVALGTGAICFGCFGPTGAAGAAIAASILFDAVHTVAAGDEGKSKGVWTLRDSRNPEDIEDVVKTVISDGLIGYTGGKVAERAERSSEIDAFERVKATRASLGLADPVANMEVWTEVKDLETGKTHYGNNRNIRRKTKLTEPRDPKPNIYVENNPIKEDLPIDREAQTCAEMHAFHQMLKDRPDADVTKTEVHTFVLLQDGKFKNITRCDNCMTRANCMGKVPTDTAKSLYCELDVPELYNLMEPNLWYFSEHTISTRVEYNERIRKAVSAYHELQQKEDESERE